MGTDVHIHGSLHFSTGWVELCVLDGRYRHGSKRGRQFRFQLDSGREYPPRNMSSSQTGQRTRASTLSAASWRWGDIAFVEPSGLITDPDSDTAMLLLLAVFTMLSTSISAISSDSDAVS
eukprot:gene24644-biopygen2169